MSNCICGRRGSDTQKWTFAVAALLALFLALFIVGCGGNSSELEQRVAQHEQVAREGMDKLSREVDILSEAVGKVTAAEEKKISAFSALQSTHDEMKEELAIIKQQVSDLSGRLNSLKRSPSKQGQDGSIEAGEDAESPTNLQPALSAESPLQLVKAWLVHDGGGVPELRVVVRNVSSKTVVSYELKVECFDRYGKPVEGTTGAGHTYNAPGKFVIKPGDVQGESSFWTLVGFNATTKVRVVLTEVRFGDGTVWRPQAGRTFSIEGELQRKRPNSIQ